MTSPHPKIRHKILWRFISFKVYYFILYRDIEIKFKNKFILHDSQKKKKISPFEILLSSYISHLKKV